MTAPKTRRRERKPAVRRAVLPARYGPGQSVSVSGLIRHACDGAMAVAQRERLSVGT